MSKLLPPSPGRSIRHINRYREIIGVLIHHGLEELIDVLGLQPYLSLPRRMLGRARPTTPPRIGMPQRLRKALEELGPTFIKLGQVLSTRPDLLPPEYIAELAKLQDTVPPEPWASIREQIEAELGAPPEQRLGTFDPEPIAAASLAQVHTATLPDGVEVVLKVQRPGIQKTIETDLEIVQDVAALLQERTPLGELYDLPRIAEEFATTLRAELNFRREGQNADRFREAFTDEPYLHIPVIHWDYTTRRLLVMERLRGIKIDNFEALDAAGYDRSRIARHAARMIIEEVLEKGFFHADPHPGNFVVMTGEVIGAMDFGMVGYLSQSTQADLIRLYIALIEGDVESVVDQLIRMGAVRGELDRAALRQDLSRLIRKYRGMPLGDIRTAEAINEAMPIAFRHRLQLPPDLWLLGKTLGMMEGIGKELDPEFNIFTFSEPYVRRFVLKLASPRSWGLPLVKGTADWIDLMQMMPRVGTQLLTRAESGDLEIRIRHEGLPRALTRLDRLANRLSLSVLLAALIVGLALVIPAFNLAERGGLATVLVIASFAGASLLGLWLAFSIWRSRK